MLDYIKEIQNWCKLKIALWGRQSNVVFKQGDIWWCSLGVNLGEEALGKSWVMLNQARILDKKRLTNKIGALDDSDFKKVKERFLNFYNV
jgi:mRNA-degrading endonuclease toxin of MazEF toxin-antitoxin module